MTVQQALETKGYRPKSEKCTIILAEEPCDAPYLPWVMCYAWHKIHPKMDKFTMREVFRKGLDEAREIKSKCRQEARREEKGREETVFYTEKGEERI